MGKNGFPKEIISNNHFTFTMTLYLSYPMMTMVMIEMTPKSAPVKAQSLHPDTYQVLSFCQMNHVTSLTKMSPHPDSISEAIDDYTGTLGDHHAQVREGQVDNKHIGRSS